MVGEALVSEPFTLLGTVVLLQLELKKAPSPILLVLFTRKGDTKTFSSTHEELELSSPIGLMNFSRNGKRLRMSQLIMMNYRMCVSPPPVMGGGLLL